MSWNGQNDRRGYKRAAIRIQSEFGDPASPTRIETVDFSAGGFSCVMDRVIEPLTKLALRFEFPSFDKSPGQVVEGEAIVVRCEKREATPKSWLMAATLTTISDTDRDFINRFVAWHETVMTSSDREGSDSVD